MSGQNASLKKTPRFFALVFFLLFPDFLAAVLRRGADLRAGVRFREEELELDFLAGIMDFWKVILRSATKKSPRSTLR